MWKYVNSPLLAQITNPKPSPTQRPIIGAFRTACFCYWAEKHASSLLCKPLSANLALQPKPERARQMGLNPTHRRGLWSRVGRRIAPDLGSNGPARSRSLHCNPSPTGLGKIGPNPVHRRGLWSGAGKHVALNVGPERIRTRQPKATAGFTQCDLPNTNRIWTTYFVAVHTYVGLFWSPNWMGLLRYWIPNFRGI